MADVYVRLSMKAITRTMKDTFDRVRVDLDDEGEMVGVELMGAIGVTWDGQELGKSHE